MALDIEHLLEIKLNKEDDFLKVRETLTRIGVASRKEKKLYQSCHILHKRGKYYIVHFKELFALDGKSTDFDENDLGRRNTISNLLAEWGLIEIVDVEKSKISLAPLSQIKVISYNERVEWDLVAKYNIGNKKKPLNVSE
jgi:hypothetical protein